MKTFDSFVEEITKILSSKIDSICDGVRSDSVAVKEFDVLLNAYDTFFEEEHNGSGYIYSLRNNNDVMFLMTRYNLSFYDIKNISVCGEFPFIILGDEETDEWKSIDYKKVLDHISANLYDLVENVFHYPNTYKEFYDQFIYDIITK